MRELHNQSRYITPDTLRQCFEKGKTLHVDKVLCGNGFTTAFLKEKPPEGMMNVIIVPNKQVLISKEKDNPSPHNVRFIYEESKNKTLNGADILMFVADSFTLNLSALIAVRDQINWILIDEWHSVEIQSNFRYRLVHFLHNFKHLKNAAITTVTATPNYAAPIDIRIINPEIKPLTIHVTNNRAESVIRVLMSIKNGHPTLVCTNDQKTLTNLKYWDKSLKARYMIGDNLARSLVQKVVVKEDPEALLVVASSRGFEGMDLLEPNYHVYFFESRGNSYECFYISNLYQAMNRPRNGVAYAEYCRNELSDRRRFEPDEAEVMRFIERTDLSPEQKHSNKYAEYKPYTVFKTNDKGQAEILPNDAAIRLRREKLKYDVTFRAFPEFCNARNITFIDLDEAHNKLPAQRTHLDEKIRLLECNEQYIDRYALFGDDFRFMPRQTDDAATFLKELEEWQILKNYNGKRGQIKRERLVKEALENLSKHANAICDTRMAKWLDEHGRNKAYEKLKEFRKRAPILAGEVLCGLVNDPIDYRANWVANRNYNVLTTLSIDNIVYLCGLVEIEVQVVDIRQCFPRLVYAMAGLPLPRDFYGDFDEGRNQRKRAKNIALNMIWYDPKAKSPKAAQRKRAKDRLSNAGYDWRVVELLLDTYFETPYKGDFFNQMAWHEKKIIGQVKAEFEAIGGHSGVVRRHDSLVIFDANLNLDWLNDFEYLGQKGWFDVAQKPQDEWYTVHDEAPF